MYFPILLAENVLKVNGQKRSRALLEHQMDLTVVALISALGSSGIMKEGLIRKHYD